MSMHLEDQEGRKKTSIMLNLTKLISIIFLRDLPE